MSEIGNILRSAREKKRLSVDEVAEAIHIKASFLEALEQGEYSLLPGPAYITGFLRNYARYLGLHPDDVIQEYYAEQPAIGPSVKAATRVLANGHHRHNRKRLLWTMAALVLLLAAGFAIKQFDDAYARPDTTALNVTPANLGGAVGAPSAHSVRHTLVRVQLLATAPVWVRVTADGVRVYQGLLRARMGVRVWTAHHNIYVLTYNGAHLRMKVNNRLARILASGPGPMVEMATPTGYHQVS